MTTAPEPALDGRSLVYPRGKVLGGCTSVNGMIYMRGQAADYDHWRQLGNVGWAWDDVLPYFLKSEDHHAGASAMHAAGGRWKVAKQRVRWPILEAVQEGAKEFGIRPRADFNDGDNEGSGFFEVNQRKGVRWNAADGFLRPAMKRPNLRVVTRAETERLFVENREARGVIFRRRGVRRQVRARGEVLLAAGAINAPKLPRALRHRPARAPRPPRHRSRPRKPGRRREPAGPPADPHRLQGAERDDAERPGQQRVGQASDRAGVCAAAVRSDVDGAEPVRHVHQVGSGPRDAGPRVPRPAALDGPAGRSAASVSGHHRVGLQSPPREPRDLPRGRPRAGTASRDPAELPFERRRPARRRPLRPPGPPDHERPGAAGAMRPRSCCPAPRHGPTRR